MPSKKDWDNAETKAAEFLGLLNLTEKSRMVTGTLDLSKASCVGNILPIDRVDFTGLCLQDGVSGVNLADLTSVFPASLTAGASWDRRLLYERGRAMGQEFRDKGIHVALG